MLSDQTVTTPYGPLSALDRDFVTKVRLAGLWELPAGQQAEEKGTTAAVRTAGQHLIDGHTFLDERVRDVAAQLGCRCPTSRTRSNSSGSPPSTRRGAWTSTASSPTSCASRTAGCSRWSRRSGPPRRTRWCAPSPTTRTRPSWTTSGSWRPPVTSTSPSWPGTWRRRARPRPASPPRPTPARSSRWPRPSPRPTCSRRPPPVPGVRAAVDLFRPWWFPDNRNVTCRQRSVRIVNKAWRRTGPLA